MFTIERHSITSSTGRIHHAMVTNPVYEVPQVAPVYDTVQNKRETMPADTENAMATELEVGCHPYVYPVCSGSIPNESTTVEDGRLVQQLNLQSNALL